MAATESRARTELAKILPAFHDVESTARQLREHTLARSTAGAIKAVQRSPTPELVELLERYEQAAERLMAATGANTVREARDIARGAQRLTRRR